MKIIATNDLMSRSTAADRGANRIGFGATPEQILKASSSMKLCPDQKSLLKDIAQFFSKAEKKIYKSLDISLSEAGNLPKNFSDVDVDGLSVGQMSNLLDNQFYSCTSSSGCGACKSLRLGEYVKKLLTNLNVEEPDKIVLNRKA